MADAVASVDRKLQELGLDTTADPYAQQAYGMVSELRASVYERRYLAQDQKSVQPRPVRARGQTKKSNPQQRIRDDNHTDIMQRLPEAARPLMAAIMSPRALLQGRRLVEISMAGGDITQPSGTDARELAVWYANELRTIGTATLLARFRARHYQVQLFSQVEKCRPQGLQRIPGRILSWVADRSHLTRNALENLVSKGKILHTVCGGHTNLLFTLPLDIDQTLDVQPTYDLLRLRLATAVQIGKQVAELPWVGEMCALGAHIVHVVVGRGAPADPVGKLIKSESLYDEVTLPPDQMVELLGALISETCGCVAQLEGRNSGSEAGPSVQ